MTAQKNLTLIEASCIITGYGVGGGILAVPYLASLNGAAAVVITILAAYLFSLLMHLMIAELCVGEGGSVQVVEVFRKYLFKGRYEKLWVWLFFTLLVLVFLISQAAYIVGAGEILVDLTGWPLWICEIAFYLIAAGVVAFGLKVLGISEKYAVAALGAILLLLAAGSLTVPFKSIPLAGTVGNASLALFGMTMFCFSAPFAVPQAVEGLSWNKRLIPRAVLLGMGFNLIIIAVFVFFSLSVSTEVTRVAIIGWAGALGGWAKITGLLFMVLAILTTYWSASYALVVIIKERTGWSERLSWLAATLPTLLIAVAGTGDFLELMRDAAGGVALCVVIMLIPAFRGSRKYKAISGYEGWNMGAWGGTTFQLVVIVTYVLTAVGSFVRLP